MERQKDYRGVLFRAVPLIISGMIIGVLGMFFLFGCGTFKPYISDQPPPCDDTITFMRLITKTNGVFNKSGTTAFTTLLTLTYQDCKTARENLVKEIKAQEEKIRFNDCKKIIYGKILEAKEENYKKYTEFQECLNQK